MCPVQTLVLLAPFLAFDLSTSVVTQHFRNCEEPPPSSGENGQHGPKRVYSNCAESHNGPVQSRRAQTENAHSSGGNACNVELQSRFDCARDKLLSQRQCEDRGCCYAPVLDTAGPPWCFYPSLYPGYQTGPFTPTKRGKTANLTRTIPSYLPADVQRLKLEVVEETAGCLHITVSILEFFFLFLCFLFNIINVCLRPLLFQLNQQKLQVTFNYVGLIL